jgi:hypothetical protein
MNDQIRNVIKRSHYFNYEIAAIIGITECTFSKWFRKPLTETQKKAILQAIEKLKEESQKCRA